MLKNKSLEEFGYNFLGPILSKYTQEVYKKVRSMEGDVKVFHLAREGYALQQAFNILNVDDIPTSYLYVSRTFLFRILSDVEESWEFSVKHSYEGNLGDFFHARYAFTSEQIDKILSEDELDKKICLPQDFEFVCGILSSKRIEISNIVSQTRDVYLEYLEAVGFSSKDRIPVVLDVGYSGTIQKLLTMLVNKNTHGIYMLTTKSYDHKFSSGVAHIDHVFKTNVKMGGGYKLLDRSMFLEALLTSPDGQFIDILKGMDSKSYHYCFGKRTYTQDNYGDLSVLIKGALDCVRDNEESQISFSVVEIEDIYDSYVSQRNLLPRAAWPLFVLDDAISGEGNLNPLDFFGL